MLAPSIKFHNPTEKSRTKQFGETYGQLYKDNLSGWKQGTNPGGFGVVDLNYPAGIARKRIIDNDNDNQKRVLQQEFDVSHFVAKNLKDTTRTTHTLLLDKSYYTSIFPSSIFPRPKKHLPLSLCNGTDLLHWLLGKDDRRPWGSHTSVFIAVATAVITVFDELQTNLNKDVEKADKLKWFQHCDLKPENIMLCEDNKRKNVVTARVIDFGLASVKPFQGTHGACTHGTYMYHPNGFLSFWLMMEKENMTLPTISKTSTTYRTIKDLLAKAPPRNTDVYGLACVLFIILGFMDEHARPPMFVEFADRLMTRHFLVNAHDVWSHIHRDFFNDVLKEYRAWDRLVTRCTEFRPREKRCFESIESIESYLKNGFGNNGQALKGGGKRKNAKPPPPPPKKTKKKGPTVAQLKQGLKEMGCALPLSKLNKDELIKKYQQYKRRHRS